MINQKLRKRKSLKARLNRHNLEKDKVIVFKSINHIYAQVISYLSGNVITEANSLQLSNRDNKNKVVISAEVGKLLKEKLIAKQYTKKLWFDRNGYRYHGRVKALAEEIKDMFA